MPPHSELIKDKSSRLGSCCSTETMCAVRTLVKVMSTERMDGGNCPRAEMESGSVATRPIKVSL